MKKAVLFASLLVVALAPIPLRSQDGSEAPAEETPDPSNSGMLAGGADPSASSSDVSTEDLNQLVNLPLGAAIGREMDEDPSKVKGLSEDKISKIFGANKPKFIYYPNGPDPMIIPWVRENTIALEMFEAAQAALAGNDLEKAKGILSELKEKYPKTDIGSKIDPALVEVQKRIEIRDNKVDSRETPDPALKDPPPLELPEWIKTNTTAILLSDTPVVVIGNDFVAVGESVPRFNSVKVKSITPSEVVYTYGGKEFSIEVNGSL